MAATRENDDRIACQLISFNILEDDELTTELVVRVNGKWFHITVDTESFSSSRSKPSKLKRSYTDLRDAAGQETANEDLEKPKEDVDSGYASERSTAEKSDNASTGEDADKALQNWLLAPFGNIFDTLAPSKESEASGQSIYGWYSDDLYLFRLQVNQDDELEPVEMEDEDALKQIRRSFCPSMTLPKYLRNLSGVSWYSPKDLQVLTESEDPAPVHPTTVRFCPSNEGHNKHCDSDTLFFKTHDPKQEAATKREIRHLHEIEKRELHKQGVNVPRLVGLVSCIDAPSSKAQVLGFLLTSISNPTPLNTKMDDAVDKSKREKWAKESEQMVKILHESGIVWGDAKADNFVVDDQEKLWMIDFGGGYTEGWVDPKLIETRDGDDQGIQKVVDALLDPNANTIEGNENQQVGGPSADKKRRRKDDDNSDDTNEGDIGQRRRAAKGGRRSA